MKQKYKKYLSSLKIHDEHFIPERRVINVYTIHLHVWALINKQCSSITNSPNSGLWYIYIFFSLKFNCGMNWVSRLGFFPNLLSAETLGVCQTGRSGKEKSSQRSSRDHLLTSFKHFCHPNFIVIIPVHNSHTASQSDLPCFLANSPLLDDKFWYWLLFLPQNVIFCSRVSNRI